MNLKERKIIDQALQILSDHMQANPITVTHPATSAELIQLQLAGREHEVFMVLFLNTRHHLIEAVELFRGTIDGAAVYPREVAKEALLRNAAAVVLGHNHPSGVHDPSLADQAITRRIKDALGLLEVRLLDHIVVGGSGYTSMAEQGLI